MSRRSGFRIRPKAWSFVAVAVGVLVRVGVFVTVGVLVAVLVGEGGYVSGKV